MKNFIIEGDAKRVVDLIMKASKIVSWDVNVKQTIEDIMGLPTWYLIQLVHGPIEREIG